MDERKKVLTYAEAGVDIDAGEREVELISKSVQATYTRGVLGDLGGFGGLFRLKDELSEDPILVSGTDGVGTKLRLAIEMGIHHTIGQDCVAMSVNDVLVQGARPLFFLDYIATGKLDRKNLITGEKITAGDVILGLPSTGIHSNGYSLVRRIISDNHLNLKETYEGFDKPLGEVVLTPTKLYPKLVLPVLKGADVKGLVHITGGGFYDNIPRVLPEGTRAVLDADKWPLLPIFSFIKEQGGVEPREMYRTFNCGLGMLLILSRGEAEKAKKILKNIGEAVYEVGTISEGNRDVIVTGGLFHE